MIERAQYAQSQWGLISPTSTKLRTLDKETVQPKTFRESLSNINYEEHLKRSVEKKAQMSARDLIRNTNLGLITGREDRSLSGTRHEVEQQ